MAKRKSRRSKKNQIINPSQIQLRPEVQAQANNLAFLETWLGGLPKVSDVPIAQALTYEMIQVVNRIWVQEQQRRVDNN